MTVPSVVVMTVITFPVGDTEVVAASSVVVVPSGVSVTITTVVFCLSVGFVVTVVVVLEPPSVTLTVPSTGTVMDVSLNGTVIVSRVDSGCVVVVTVVSPVVISTVSVVEDVIPLVVVVFVVVVVESVTVVVTSVLPS